MLIGGVGIGFSSGMPGISHIQRNHPALFYVGIIGFVLDRLIAGVGKIVTRGTSAAEEIYHAGLSEARHIDKSFTRGNAHRGAEGHHLTIDKGEYVSIIGHSGCASPRCSTSWPG